MTTRRRAGDRPALSAEGPQRQLTQQSPPELWGRLVFEAMRVPHVREGHSAVSPASSRALIVVDRDAPAVPEATLAPGAPLEPVHLHGVDDTSLHLVLPRARAEEVCALGWGVPHQYGDFGTEVLVYGPRDDAELEVVLGLVRESVGFARGE